MNVYTHMKNGGNYNNDVILQVSKPLCYSSFRLLTQALVEGR